MLCLDETSDWLHDSVAATQMHTLVNADWRPMLVIFALNPG